MSAAPKLVGPAPAPAAAARPPATPAPADAPAIARRLVARLRNEWMPRAAWTISRTGRPGLIGIALLLLAAVFLFSTHLKVASEVEALRADLAAAQLPAHAATAARSADPVASLRTLPPRTDMPAILRQLFNKASAARLALDLGKYDVTATEGSAVVRHQITFPVAGPYPQVRAFIDATLLAMPAVGLGDLVLDRKAIGDPNVDAQIRMTVYTSTTGAPGSGGATAAPPVRQASLAAETDLAHARAQAQLRASTARTASQRVVAPSHASALFAPHSWYVAPPPPPPAPPPPAPEPTAPPFPFTFIGSFTPDGQVPVFFLAKGDHVMDARVGDTLDGVYKFESADHGQLVFVYLPLNIRQTLASGAPQ